MLSNIKSVAFVLAPQLYNLAYRSAVGQPFAASQVMTLTVLTVLTLTLLRQHGGQAACVCNHMCINITVVSQARPRKSITTQLVPHRGRSSVNPGQIRLHVVLWPLACMHCRGQCAFQCAFQCALRSPGRWWAATEFTSHRCLIRFGTEGRARPMHGVPMLLAAAAAAAAEVVVRSLPSMAGFDRCCSLTLFVSSRL